METKKIQHLLFDFGGVLYQIDQEKTLTLFKDYIDNKQLIQSLNLNDFLANPFFKKFETGMITAAEFRDAVRNYFNISISNKKFDEFWNATLIAPFSDTYKMLNTVKKHYKIHLLSNTNEIHYNYFYPQCRDFLSLFDNEFYSHKIGLMKPDAEVFKYVTKELNTQPENILFIDDLKRNIVSAKSLGLQTYLFDYDKNRKKLLDILLRF